MVGRTAKDVAVGDALDHVAGYMLLNDLSARDLQFQTPQWIPGKVFDGSAPCGPALVTADEAGAPGRDRPQPRPRTGSACRRRERGPDLRGRRARRPPLDADDPGPGRHRLDRHAVGRRRQPPAAHLARSRATRSSSARRSSASCARRSPSRRRPLGGARRGRRAAPGSRSARSRARRRRPTRRRGRACAAGRRASRAAARRRSSPSIASTSSRPRSGPSTSAIATARFSSTTGEGSNLARARRRGGRFAPSRCPRRRRRASVLGGDRRLHGVGAGRTAGRRRGRRGHAAGDLVGAATGSRSCSASATNSPRGAGARRLGGRGSAPSWRAARAPRAAVGRVAASSPARRIASAQSSSRRSSSDGGPHVALVEDQVERREHRRQALGHALAIGHLVADPRVADLPLRANQPLRHRGLGAEQERARDLGRAQPAEGPQGRAPPATRRPARGGSR